MLTTQYDSRVDEVTSLTLTIQTLVQSLKTQQDDTASLGGLSIEDRALPSICEAIGANPAIHKLCLYFNGITDSGLEPICQLITSGKVTELDISDNCLTEDGVLTLKRTIGDKPFTLNTDNQTHLEARPK